MFLAVLPACPQWPPFYNWLPNDPQFSGFFTPMTLLLLHLVRNGLVFTRVVYWMTPYFGEYTFYLIGPCFWHGVGTYLSLQIGSAPPGAWSICRVQVHSVEWHHIFKIGFIASPTGKFYHISRIVYLYDNFCTKKECKYAKLISSYLWP